MALQPAPFKLTCKLAREPCMKSLNSIELLKEALLILSNELEETQKQSKYRLEVLEKVFPYDLYKTIRPDVARKIGSEEDILLNHFLRHGDKEMNIKALIQENINSFSKEIKSKCLRDTTMFTFADTADSSRETKRQLLKTINTKENINSNPGHSFALKHTLIHLKSNTVATWIPKIACSNIRYSIAYANGAITGEEDINWIHRNNAEFNASNKELLQADYTFVILRNPFKRLLSFFTDKICHAEENIGDPSYLNAMKIFEADKIKNFHNFIDLIWSNPNLIKLDEHTRHQCDFLIYEKYDDYFSLENYQAAVEKLQNRAEIRIKDVRKFNSIYTTNNCIEATELGPSTSLSEINESLAQKKKPIPENMYTEDMINKVATLYLPDIMLYCNSLENGEREMKHWIRKGI